MGIPRTLQLVSETLEFMYDVVGGIRKDFCARNIFKSAIV
ncbi:hypothetical protein SAMN05421659_110113 [[Clostridium] fimetarium]|uniref:Uncharacterized protein n=1 Tax=[Clostridium] fimetarium TaxID=99656 RepID=A0A1I0R1F2_9FIRM|nr:hypothetical protein SAMN05421659_110113 [[Clostridium] fimetarium]